MSEVEELEAEVKELEAQLARARRKIAEQAEELACWRRTSRAQQCPACALPRPPRGTCQCHVLGEAIGTAATVEGAR